MPVREQLSLFRPMLTLAAVMTASRDVDTILRLAATAVPSFARAMAVGAHLDGTWQPAVPTLLRDRERVTLQLAGLGHSGGQVQLAESAWAYAYALVGPGDAPGHLVVAAGEAPADHECFLLDVLTQQTTTALANAQLYARERRTASALRDANDALDSSVQASRRILDVHDRLTRAAGAGRGLDGIVLAVHQLTGRAVAVEDRYGTLLAWAGPGEPEQVAKESAVAREQMLRTVSEADHPCEHEGRLLALARAGGEVLGVVALTGGDVTDFVALEHGATVVALELARLRSVTEAELRLRRDLLEELLAGVGLETAVDRARAVGYDLARPHRVLVVQALGWTGPGDELLRAARRGARDVGVGSLLAPRGHSVAVLAESELDWELFREAVEAALALTTPMRPAIAIGVGGPCRQPAEFALSHRQAQLALRLQLSTSTEGRVAVFEELGVYKLLSQIPDLEAVQAFIHQWLGPLLEHDATKHAELVPTLSAYLESGGSYDKTAESLSLHRSSLRYRLQRVRDISRYDIADPDTRFNLQLACRAWDTLVAQGHMEQPHLT